MASSELVPHSCKHCQKLVIDMGGPMTSGSNVFISDITLPQMIQSSKEGCPLFQWILKDDNIARADESGDLVLSIHTYQSSGRPPDIEQIEFFGLWSEESKDAKSRTRHGAGFMIYTFSDNVAGRYVYTRPINCEPGSKQNFQLARTWLRECLEGHEGCSKPDLSFMPTRVLEISREEKSWSLRINHTAKKAVEPYTALSYCWGGNQPVKATNKVLRSWETAIPCQNLPKTVQDAVTATLELNIRFLWIDSFCIIQDNPEDLAREIAQMPHIYNHATVTIAASGANNVREGFLAVRDIKVSPNLVFELRYRCPTGELGSVILCRPFGTIGNEPLDSRAWALQERLLASRVLEYATRQLRWICASVEYKDGYTDGWRSNVEYDQKRHDSLNHEIFDPKFGKKAPLSKVRELNTSNNPIKHWNSILEKYTRRELTVPTDRILAISGIAAKYGEILQDDYLAGLWKSDFPFELLWTLNYPHTRLPRPQAYQAPSWSWASVNGPTSRDKGWGIGEAYRKKVARLELLDYQCELVNNEAPYGAVKFGHLRVRGRIKSVIWERRNGLLDFDSDKNDFPRPFINRLASKKTDRMADTHETESEELDRLSSGIVLDALEDDFDNKNIRSIPISLLEVVHFGSSCQGLALRALGNGFFARIGIFGFHNEVVRTRQGVDREVGEEQPPSKLHWFDSYEPQIITIV